MASPHLILPASSLEVAIDIANLKLILPVLGIKIALQTTSPKLIAPVSGIEIGLSGMPHRRSPEGGGKVAT